MKFNTISIPKLSRNKYNYVAGSGYGGESTFIGGSVGSGGLPYYIDENGNYVIEKKTIFNKSVISKEELVAYGEDSEDYKQVYAAYEHAHSINDITGLREELDNIVTGGGTGGTASIQVIDNLESTSSTAALSARQGKILSELIADKSSISSWNDIKDKPSVFPPSTHSHAISDVSDLQGQLDGKASTNHNHSISTITGLQGQLDSKASSSHTHSIGNISNLQAELNSKASSSHLHDDRYYTETEVNNLLATKASSSHTHTIANITNLEIELNNKSDVNHTHSISAVTNLQTQLDSKVNTSSISTLSVKNSDTVDNLHASSFMRSDTDTTCSGNITVGGNLVANGEITAYSDKRLKTDIQSLDNRGLLNPVTYLKDGKQQIGFIAQEVQEVYPELITESNGYLSLNYQQLTAVLSSQINDLYSIIDELKLEISRLKNKPK